jgi:tetratricopeptide (TPR) repeat protein
VLVERNLTQGNHPQTNDPPIQSKIVASYNVETLPENWLAWAAVLHAKAGDSADEIAVLTRLASEKNHANGNQAFATIDELTDALSSQQAIDLLQKVPVNSDLQPRAVKKLTEMLLWDQGDFVAAADALAPFASRHDGGINRRRGEALVLAGKLDDAKKIFAGLHASDPSDRAAAISGAMARTVEYFLTEKDVHSGEDAWEKWQNRFPDSFLEGYSVVLRVKLMALAEHTAAAAKVAEAFADAVPRSSYSPQLLDEASKLLASSDAAKSAELHATLKQRYPEDPLSNQ